MSTIEERLQALGLEIPAVPTPVANYVGHVVTGRLVFVSGQLPIQGGKVAYLGKLGADLDVPAGQAAARLCGVNILAQLKAATGGELTRIKRIVRLGGFVNSTPEFVEQPQVINGVSDLMVEVFGDEGKHSRAAVSVNSLPLGAAVEVDALAELHD